MSKKEEGKKFDGNKPPISLIPTETIIGMAEVLAMGRDKYGALNWTNGLNYSRLIDATYRHLIAFQQGQDLDLESSKSHLLHAMVNLSFLHYFTLHKTEFDDRWENKNKQ